MAPTILRTGSLAFRIYPQDHLPPHVHVIGPDAEARFRLDEVECLTSRGFSRKALKQIEEFVTRNAELLLEAWDEYQS